MRKSDSSSDKKPSTRLSSTTGGRSAFGKTSERKTSSDKPTFADKYKRAEDKPRTDRIERKPFDSSEKKPFTRATSTDRKPAFGDKPRASFDRKTPFPNTDRPAYGDKPRGDYDRKAPFPKTDRPAYGDKPRGDYDRKAPFPKTDRPAYGDKPRGDYDRKASFPKTDRPAYGDKPRGDYDRKAPFPKTDRPSYGDKPKGDYDRKAPFPKTDRPSYGDKSKGDYERKAPFPKTDRPAYGDKPRGDYERKAPFPKTDRPAYGANNRTETGARPRKGTNDRKTAFTPTPRYSPNKEIELLREEKKGFRPKTYLDEPYTEQKTEKKEYSKQVGLKAKPDITERGMIDKLPPKMKSKIEKAYTGAEEIRLNKYIANAGLCSRREADEFIASGQITVNGETIVEMGYKVQPNDVIKYGRKVLSRQKLTYVLLNKPKDFITTTDDPEGRRTVMDLVKNSTQERIYPIGRLDRATTGLLLLTNDGELAEKLSHPSNEIKKIYQLEIDKKISQEHFDSILEGLELEDGTIKADDLSIISPDGMVLGIEIHSGKNRIVRRIFEHLGYEVLKLDRSTYAGLNKKDLPRGNWRYLTEKEVIRLKYLL